MGDSRVRGGDGNQPGRGTLLGAGRRLAGLAVLVVAAYMVVVLGQALTQV